VRWVAILLLWTASTQLALAQPFCDRPSRPDIPSFGAGLSSMQESKGEVDDYSNQMNEYIDCLTQEENDAADEYKQVIDEWNDAVEQFNNG
jgi:hypothetical protein